MTMIAASSSPGVASRFAAPIGIGLVALALAALPAFRPPLFFESFLYLMFFWIALSTSWTILSGFTGYVSFGHGAFYGVGMYAMADLGPKLSIWAALPFAGVSAALLGVIIGTIVFRVRRLRGELFALLTLALAIVLATIVLNTPIDGGPGVFLNGVAPPKIYTSPSSTIYLMGMCVAMGSLAIAWGIQHAKLGRGLFAISDDEDVAEILGVPTFAYKLIAIAISSGIAGVMGAVHAIFVSYVTVGETFSITVPLYVLLMAVLGGLRDSVELFVRWRRFRAGGARGHRANARPRDVVFARGRRWFRAVEISRARRRDAVGDAVGDARRGINDPGDPSGPVAHRPVGATAGSSAWRQSGVSRRAGARWRRRRYSGRRNPRPRGPQWLRQVDAHQRFERPLRAGRGRNPFRRRGHRARQRPRAGATGHRADLSRV
jgi:ABC-type branched-subunit amino acid transport system permease subunit